MSEPALQAFATGLAFPEAPRWHAGALWFSDFYLQRVCRATADGDVRTVVELDDQPSGLGWLPDGRLLVVAMHRRQVLRLDPEGLRVHADLSGLVAWPCNDMLVDAQGRAYVGNFGFDLHAKAPFAPTVLVLVAPDGATRVVADDLHFPNGMALGADGRTLIVAESYGKRLTAFDVEEDGGLRDRRVWARFEEKGVAPDGICLDAEGAVWMASPVSREVLRVREGGAITHRIPTGEQATACAIGGEDGGSLFVTTGRVMVTPEQSRRARGGAVLRMPLPATLPRFAAGG
ncbi:SMP-30/gluconolactonase/LRE family protein [Ramlibacter sp. AN1133]|uniref:SMP-30/gluconolactonase/LRE family protein n=1 Tax=Ramlibacter sp. AN1133 TaxID=3133429 RepID=UPI0030C0C7A7